VNQTLFDDILTRIPTFAIVGGGPTGGGARGL
jgi:hypothetical protein